MSTLSNGQILRNLPEQVIEDMRIVGEYTAKIDNELAPAISGQETRISTLETEMGDARSNITGLQDFCYGTGTSEGVDDKIASVQRDVDALALYEHIIDFSMLFNGYEDIQIKSFKIVSNRATPYDNESLAQYFVGRGPSTIFSCSPLSSFYTGMVTQSVIGFQISQTATVSSVNMLIYGSAMDLTGTDNQAGSYPPNPVYALNASPRVIQDSVFRII